MFLSYFTFITKEKLHFSLISKVWALKIAEQLVIRVVAAYKPVAYKKYTIKEFFFYLGFLSRTFTIHRCLDINRVITAGSSPLYITSSRTRTLRFRA